MWISRKEYQLLIERLENLEQSQIVVYGTHVFGGRSVGSTAWRKPHERLVGGTVSAHELLCKIADHFGFYYEPSKPGYLAAPKTESKVKIEPKAKNK